MSGKLLASFLVTAWLAFGAAIPRAYGDGGAVRFSERRADRLITVFTAPTPLRAGPVDVSVLVQDVTSGKAMTDIPILVRAYSIQHPSVTIHASATTEAATNKLMRAATLDISEAGQWQVEVIVQGTELEPLIRFDVDVADALPPWVELGFWIGWPAAVVALFAVHQLLVNRHRAIFPRSARKG